MKLNEQNFQNLVSYWAGKLQLPLPLFRRDNRMYYSAVVTYCDECSVFNLTYNFKQIEKCEQSEVAGLVFHELGHIKHKTYKLKDSIESEYLAEKFSIQCLKKHYPDFHKKEIKAWRKKIKDQEWREENPIHAEAFGKIKEYK